MITVETSKNMSLYKCEQGQNSISVVQMRVEGKWKTYVSSVLRVAFGMFGEHETYQEMFAETFTLMQECEDVLKLLDQRQREMGDEYVPPATMGLNRVYDKSMARDYIVVNLSRFSLNGGHPICGYEPETLDLDKAVELVLDLEDEFGHTPETAAIYKITPLPIDDVMRLADEARGRRSNEDE